VSGAPPRAPGDPGTAMPLVALALALERAAPDAPAIGEATDPAAERVRFRAHPGLGFPDREVRAVAEPAAGGAPTVVFQSLIGLHGPSSPLPPYFTERVIADDGAEGTLAAFLDFFNHRLAGFLVRAFRHRRYHLRYRPGGLDPISRRALALAGVPPAGDDGLPPPPRLLPVLGLLALADRSATALAAVVTAVCGLPCRIEEFVPRTIEIPPEDRARMGLTGSMLGVDMVIGERIEDRLGGFRVVIGPVGADALASLLPGSPGRRALDELVAFAVRAPLACDVAIVLAAGETPAWRLGEGRLGWTTWAEPDPARESVVVL
jgi:type VI secretion system protein ImpH